MEVLNDKKCSNSKKQFCIVKWEANIRLEEGVLKKALTVLQKRFHMYQWSTEPKQDSVIFGFRFGSARFGSFRFFQKNRTEYLQDKIKYKRVSRSFNRNIFLKKIQ